MNSSSAKTTAVLQADRPRTNTRLQGSWLVLSRLLWVALLVFCWSLSIVSLPVYIARLQTVCVRGPCVSEQLTAGSVLALQQLGLSPGRYALIILTYNIITGLVSFAVAVVLLWRKSDDWMALLVAFPLAQPLPLDLNALLLSNQAWSLLSKCASLLEGVWLVLLFSLFPSGRFVPRWMRWFALVFLLLIGVSIFFPAPFDWSHWPPLFNLLLAVALSGSFVGGLVGAQIYRYRCVSDRIERQQTKWVVFAFSIFLLGVVLSSFVTFSLPNAFPALRPPPIIYVISDVISSSLLPTLIPLSLGIAILRFHLWDIDLIINRTLVYAILTASVLGIYVLLVGALGSLFQIQSSPGISLLATGLIAVLFQPLRSRLQRAVNRLMFGERDEPYVVLSRLGQRLEATLAPDAVLHTIVETVAQALKLPYAAIGLLQDGGLTITAAYGKETDTLLRLPLVYQSEPVGELLLATRSPGESFSPADRRLFDDLARQAGVAAHAVRLTTDLQRSRERLVTTREEERRRLRRDLHDGLGPQLASQTLTLTAVRKLLRRDPETAEMLLADAIVHAQQAITDIRRLIYDLRPPALDDLGLPGALREQLQQYRGSDMTFALEAPERFPPLSAAVEVACYRIVQEAVTNVVRHARASACTVRLTLETSLCIDILDNGVGLPQTARTGLGLTSMRERATELGGSCLIESIPAGGTHVGVRLPMS